MFVGTESNRSIILHMHDISIKFNMSECIHIFPYHPKFQKISSSNSPFSNHNVCYFYFINLLIVKHDKCQHYKEINPLLFTYSSTSK